MCYDRRMEKLAKSMKRKGSERKINENQRERQSHTRSDCESKKSTGKESQREKLINLV